MWKSSFIDRLNWIVLALFVLAAFAAVASGIGYRLQLWGLRPAFIVLLSAAAIAAVVALLALVGLTYVWRSEHRLVGVAVIALLGSALTAAMPLSQLWIARHRPPIHDITTDTDDPPAFVALLVERQGAPNPAAYGGAEVAALQRNAYPDLQPLSLRAPRAAVFDAALDAARKQGWRIVATDRAGGRLEASDQTFWFGFIDDIVVRVTASPDEMTRVDARSVSRVGRGDVGKNADRLRSYLKDIDRRLGSTR